LKFKFIFILFSITMLLFLSILIFLPYFFPGYSISDPFWQVNWPLILIMALIFVGFSIFYFSNRRLFFLLEMGNWPALVRHLEDRVIQKGKFSPRLVRLLANSYLILSDSEAVMTLENKVVIAKPGLVDEYALIFGTARILGKDISGAVRFFGSRKNTVKAGHKEWMNWYYGFALLLDRRYEDAGEEFSVLARVSKNSIITALSSYFLSETISRFIPVKDDEFREIASEGRKKVLKTLPLPKNWYSEVSRISNEIHTAAISKYMTETGQWLYQG